MNSNQNILVTGGAGYIGSILTSMLLEKGFNVVVIDSFIYKQNSLSHLIWNKNLKVIKGDVRNEEVMRKYLDEADIVIPLAAIVGAPACALDPIRATSVNKDSILALIQNLDQNKWIIMPTTNSGYGTSPEGEFLDEDAELNPLSLYAKDKVEVEKHLIQRGNFTSFRLATVFGMSPRMRLDLLVNSFVKSAINPGYIVLFESHYRRNFIHVYDVARAFLHAIEKKNMFIDQIFNVGLSSANISKMELAQLIKLKIPTFEIFESVQGEDPDKRNYLISNEKIEKTGFACSVSLSDGIDELIRGIMTLNLEKYSNL